MLALVALAPVLLPALPQVPCPVTCAPTPGTGMEPVPFVPEPVTCDTPNPGVLEVPATCGTAP